MPDSIGPPPRGEEPSFARSSAGFSWDLAAAWAGPLGALAYALLRLWDAIDEPPLGTVRATAFIPYYWRCAQALFLGCTAGALVGLFFRGPAATPAWTALPHVSLLIALVITLTMLGVP